VLRHVLLTLLTLALAATGLVAVSAPAQAVNGYNGSMNDLASPAPGLLRVRGWVYDDDNGSAPVQLQLFVGGTFSDPNAEYVDLGVTNVARPDVQAAYPGVAGPNTGFDRTVEVTKTGNQPIYLYALNAVGPDPGPAVLVSGTTVVINNPDPYGEILSATSPAPGQVAVSGSAIQNDRTESTRVSVTTNGTHAGTLVADQTGSGFYEDYPVIFNGTVPSPGGDVQVCVTAINQGPGRDKSLGCRQVQVVPPPPPPVQPPVPPTAPSEKRITVKLKALKKKGGKPRLRIDVGPDLNPSNYQVRILRKAGKKWRVVTRTQTLGPRDRVTVKLKPGRYRVVVPRQHGMAGTSATIRLKR
jgi:hypothetical protein